MTARAQLTPLKNDTQDKIKLINNIMDERKKRVERLDPIQL